MSQGNAGMTEELSLEFLDAAACEALGASTPGESAAYQQKLASAGDDAKRKDRSLREMVALLSAASPHLAPPPDLRGRILQATAPTTFRMEDYRKATKDNGWFFRWGFAAAMLFLSAGAYYNMTVKSELDRATNTAKAYEHKVAERDVALAAFVNPKAQQVILASEGKPFGKAFLDAHTQTAVVILPREMVPQGKTVQFSMQQEGKDVKYNTVLLTAPGDSLNAPKDIPLERIFAIKQSDMRPDTQNRVITAELGPRR